MCKIYFYFQESKFKVTDRQVEFILKKAADGWWPRLTATPQKPTWLKVRD
jgi:very-long-chain (3R)-3-hydroxyacyl-CoA dehydratase